jgi:hypothetical protein
MTNDSWGTENVLNHSDASVPEDDFKAEDYLYRYIIN